MKHWISAFRLRTLPLAFACVGMGVLVAGDSLKWDVFLMTILTAFLLQILSNLANDYGDTMNGADNASRVGPARASQAGTISLANMKKAIGLFIAMSLISGLTLLAIAFGWGTLSFWWYFGLGVLSIIAAITYTAGAVPYGYSALGDVAVFIFFGVVAVTAGGFLHRPGDVLLMINSGDPFRVIALSILPGTSGGMFSVAVLNVNNIRDINSDKLAGKTTIPSLIGAKAAVGYHIFVLFTGFFAMVLWTLLEVKTDWSDWLFLIMLFPLTWHIVRVWQWREDPAIDGTLKQMALLTLVFTLVKVIPTFF